MEIPSISIIVATRNRADRLEAAVRSFLLPSPIPSEIIIADDGSTDDTRERVAALADAFPGRLHYLEGPFGGPGPARNAAVKAASGKKILIADDDTEAPEGWLLRLTDAYARYQCDVLAYALAPATLAAAPAAYLHYRNQFVTGTRLRENYTGPAFFLMSRDTFLAAGGFSEDPLSAAEDFDLCFRLQRMGISILFDPSITVIHHYATDWESVRRRILATARDGARVYRNQQRSRIALTLRALLKWMISPCWTLRVFPLPLYGKALLLETLFLQERLRALWESSTP